MNLRNLKPCINCKEKPEVIEGIADKPYKFLLRHKKENPCYPTFKLESHQHTVKKCIDDWNEFNT